MPTKRTTGHKRSRNPRPTPSRSTKGADATTGSSGVGADLALAVYLEELAQGNRVLWLGPETEAVERLRRGAASVQSLALDSTLQSLTNGVKSGVAEGSVDLIVVPDAQKNGCDSREAVGLLSRTLSPKGVLVVGANAESAELDYESFYELLSDGFAQTRMFGQAAFSGWSLVDFERAAAGQAEAVLDGTAVPPEDDAPSRFLAVCNNGTNESVLEGFLVVRVPQARATPRAEDLRPQHAAEDRNELLWKAAAKRAEELEMAVADRSRELARVQAELLALKTAAQAGSAAPKEERAQVAGPKSPGAPISLEELERFTAEYDRLESELQRTVKSLAEATAEVNRRSSLVRDLVESRPASAAGGSSVGREAQQARVVQTEAMRAAAEFRGDELEAELTLAKQALHELRSQGAMSASPEAPASSTKGPGAPSASRLLELEEVKDRSEAQLSLANQDLVASRAEVLTLQRSLSELEERLEAEVVRSRSKPQERKSPAQTELRGQLDALSAKLAEREASLEEVRAEVQRTKSQKAELEVSVEQARKSSAESSGETTSLRTRVRDAEQRVLDLTTEAELLRSRVLSSNAPKPADPTALGAIQELGAAKKQMGQIKDEVDTLRDKLEELKALDSEKTLRLADAEELSELESGRAADLAGAVAARDALVNRLQVDLAEHQQMDRDATQRLGRFGEENERLRDALVQASEKVDEVERLEASLRERADEAQRLSVERDSLKQAAQSAQEGRGQDRSTLEDLGASLKSLLERLAGAGESLDARLGATSIDVDPPERDVALTEAAPAPSTNPQSTASDSPDATGPSAGSENEIAVLRRWISAMEKEAEDRETLLRSVTAQLEDRDDRIRALERRLSESGTGTGEDTETLRRELLELRERASRLAEELLSERRARQTSGPRSEGADLDRKQAELVECRRHASSLQRDLSSLQSATGRARAGLEEVMASATQSGDNSAAERIGLILRMLGS